MKTTTTQKPWGKFEQYTLNEPTTVKIIYINKGESLSLQYHKNRSEFWKIIEGNPIVTIGTEKIQAQQNDEFTVDNTIPHRIEATNENVKFLEIAHGNFDESDIVRLEDKYGREN